MRCLPTAATTPAQPSLAASHTSQRTVSRPPSTSRVTVAFLAAASSSSLEAKVACGQPSSAASIWPVCIAERQAWEGGLQGGGSSSCKQHNTTQHALCRTNHLITTAAASNGSRLCCRAWCLPPGSQSWHAAKLAFPPGCCHRQSPACPAASAPAPLSAPPAHHGFGVVCWLWVTSSGGGGCLLPPGPPQPSCRPCSAKPKPAMAAHPPQPAAWPPQAALATRHPLSARAPLGPPPWQALFATCLPPAPKVGGGNA